MNLNSLPKRSDSEQTRELLQFLRDENAANREAIRADAETNRALLLGSLRLISYPLTAALAIAAFLGWRSLQDIRRTIEGEAKQQVAAETDALREEIRKKLREEFETPVITQTVKEAAKAQTRSALLPIITRETTTQVAKAVASQQTAIRGEVREETHKAVDALSPSINSAVIDRVQTTVNERVSPVLSRLEASERLSRLFISAQGGDGRAYDELSRLDSDAKVPTADRATIENELRGLLLQYNQPYVYTTPRVSLTQDQLKQMITSSDPTLRKLGLDNSVLTQSSLDQLYSIIVKDPDLNVRRAAMVKFTALTLQPFSFLQYPPLEQWWHENRSRWSRYLAREPDFK